jgi:twitching motility protein PilU
MQELDDYLRQMIKLEASDLYLSVGAPPSVKVKGMMTPLSSNTLLPGSVKQIALKIMGPEQTQRFETTLEMNLALSRSGIGRFRVNIFQQRNEAAMVLRHIKFDIPEVTALGLPPILKELIMAKRGLILFVGATGCGKSTSLASLIDYRNQNSAGHIVMIEDPIEYIHNHKKSIVNQREIGIDTMNYGEALRNTLRQAPDVILIGEIRTQETMQYAIAFAETGHLCLATLHANNANQALDRIINFFPVHHHQQLLLDLSFNLRAIISQRLVPTIDGKLALAAEVLLGTPLVSDIIKRGEITALKDIMQRSEELGMQTFETSLFNLWKAGIISLEEALHNADSENNLRLKISLDQGVDNINLGNLTVEQKKQNQLPNDRFKK